MIRELVKPEHQLFHHRIDSCSYKLDRKFLSKTLIENMIHYNGIGISANQIGILQKIITVNIKDHEKNTEKIYSLFNPSIRS